VTDLQRGLLVWGVAFFGLELPAHWNLVPWPTLSSTVWDGIKAWHPVAYFIALALAVLLGHFEEKWSVGWLLAVAGIGTVAILIHLLTR
jgi:hypothetical protein